MNPIKPTFKTEILPLVIILVAIISSFYFYSVFPEQVATHWNFRGEADNFSSKFIGAFSIPVLLIFVYLLFYFLPFLDPKKEKYKFFAKSYHVFKNIILLFLFLTYILAGFEAIGKIKAVGVAIPLMVGVLFIIIGNYMGKIKSNWFVGIKTPWTLSSEEVWNKTHRFGGKMFILSGILIGLSPFLPDNLVLINFIFAILIVSLGTFAYSYFIYKKTDKENKK
jgi:uncharacterized membrane protein